MITQSFIMMDKKRHNRPNQTF